MKLFSSLMQYEKIAWCNFMVKKGSGKKMTEKGMEPVHPGEILQDLYLAPLKLSQNALARDIHVPPRRINEIVNRKRRITADTNLRLLRYFGMTPHYWMGLQVDYDPYLVQEELSEKNQF